MDILVGNAYLLDSYNKWPPGTAAKLTFTQSEGYLEAMYRILGGDAYEEESQDQTEDFIAIATGQKVRQ